MIIHIFIIIIYIIHILEHHCLVILGNENLYGCLCILRSNRWLLSILSDNTSPMKPLWRMRKAGVAGRKSFRSEDVLSLTSWGSRQKRHQWLESSLPWTPERTFLWSTWTLFSIWSTSERLYFLYISIYIYNVYMYVCKYVCIYIHTYIHIHMYEFRHPEEMYIYSFIYIYIYLHLF